MWAGIQTCVAAHSAAQPAHRGRPCVPSRPHPTPTPPRGLPATAWPSGLRWIPACGRWNDGCGRWNDGCGLESRRARQRTPRRSRASGPPMRPVPPSPHAHPTAWPAGHLDSSLRWNDGCGLESRRARQRTPRRSRASGPPMRPVPPSPHAHPTPTAWPAGHLDSSLRWNDGCGRWNDGCGLESRRARQRTPRRSRASGPPMRPVPPSPHAHPTAWPAGHLRWPAFIQCPGLVIPAEAGIQTCAAAHSAAQPRIGAAHASRPALTPRPPHRVACRPPGFQPSLE